jgi:hypothetical protein
MEKVSLYRFQESLWSESKLMLILASYPVIKQTPSGTWIDVYGQKKFVLRDARKHFACPTIEEALASFHARKRRQANILRHRLAMAEAAMTLKHDGDSTYFGTPELGYDL